MGLYENLSSNYFKICLLHHENTQIDHQWVKISLWQKEPEEEETAEEDKEEEEER